MTNRLHELTRNSITMPIVQVSLDLVSTDEALQTASIALEAGADAVIVMAQAHDATIAAFIAAGTEHGLLVMGDDLGTNDRVATARRLESMGIGMIIHYIGYDYRKANSDLGLSPLTELEDIVAATTAPVQAVGGLSLDPPARCPALGAPVVMFGATLLIDGHSFRAADGRLRDVLGAACQHVHMSLISYPCSAPTP